MSRHLPVLFILLGALLRVYGFPHTPAGLNQDEVSSTYEAFALLHEQTDRWGFRFPSYFRAWGTGQNVLLSYLNIPVVAVFGLEAFSVRFLALAIGILSLPLVYVVVKELCDRRVALFALFLTAFQPWHFMISRWSLESNFLPPLLLLFVYFLNRASCDRRWIVWSLLPGALAFYAYGTAVIPLPLLLLGFFVIRFENIRVELRLWCLALLLFVVSSFPFILYFLKNHIFKSNFEFEQILPFTSPLLPQTRFDELKLNLMDALRYNTQNFLLRGMEDGLPWNHLPGFKPLSLFLAPFVLLGFATLVRSAIEDFKKSNLVLVWFFACLPAFFLYALNINRINTVYFPLIVFASVGLSRLWELQISARPIGRWSMLVITLCITIQATLFFRSYFGNYDNQIRYHFRDGFREAFDRAKALADDSEPIYVGEEIYGNYIYVLFNDAVLPSQFLADSDVERKTFQVQRFSRYFFSAGFLQRSGTKTTTYLIQEGQKLPCNSSLIAEQRFGYWRVGRCQY